MSQEIENAVVVQETGEGKYTQEIKSRSHVMIGDEPKSVGGLDKGPSPYEYLLAALGSCTSMTIRMYAEFKKIPLEKVTVYMVHHRVHAEDCHDCDSKDGRIDTIERLITLEGDLTQDQREGCLRVANKCPVHKTLTHELKIRTRLEE